MKLYFLALISVSIFSLSYSQSVPSAKYPGSQLVLTATILTSNMTNIVNAELLFKNISRNKITIIAPHALGNQNVKNHCFVSILRNPKDDQYLCKNFLVSSLKFVETVSIQSDSIYRDTIVIGNFKPCQSASYKIRFRYEVIKKMDDKYGNLNVIDKGVSLNKLLQNKVIWIGKIDSQNLIIKSNCLCHAMIPAIIE